MTAVVIVPIVPIVGRHHHLTTGEIVLAVSVGLLASVVLMLVIVGILRWVTR